jgi:cytochrome P450
VSGDVLTLLRSPAGLADPYRIYAGLRARQPVSRTPGGVFVVTGYGDCEKILKDTSTFRGPARSEMLTAYPRASDHLSLQVLISQNLLGLSGPEHARLRSCMTRGLTPRRIEELRGVTENLARVHIAQLADRLRDGGPVNMHDALSVPFPLAVFARLAGLPGSDLAWYAGILPQILKSGDPAATEEDLAESDQAVAALLEYITGLAARRRQAPGDDLISALAAISDLTQPELVMLAMALLIGGFETTAAAIDNGMIALLRRGPLGAWRGTSPSGLVSEMLRYDSPAQCNPGVRLAAHTTVLGGTEIPAGSDVRAMIGAANRDPAVFADPDRFDPDRDGPPSLTFGAGRHYCPGSALARLKLDVLFPLIAEQIPGLELAGDPVRRPSSVLRAVDQLPVTLARP